MFGSLWESVKVCIYNAGFYSAIMLIYLLGIMSIKSKHIFFHW